MKNREQKSKEDDLHIIMKSLVSLLLLTTTKSTHLRNTASPIGGLEDLSNHREVLTTKCSPPESCKSTVEMGSIQNTQKQLPPNIVHTTSTNCQSDDCTTTTVSNPPPPSPLKMRVAELERLVHEKEQRDLANETLTTVTNLATTAVKQYHATLIRSAAQEIRERVSPEQMLLSNISGLLTQLTVNTTRPVSIEPETKCCQEEIAKCMACSEKIDVKTFCETHQTVEGCGGPIDLSTLNLPDIQVEEELPPTLEERVSDMEKYLTKKLHKRMDTIEANKLKKGNGKGKLTTAEMKQKIIQLSADVKKELVKKMDKMEQAKRKELMTKVEKLQKTIENGGKEEEEEEAAATATTTDDAQKGDGGKNSGGGSGGESVAAETSNKDIASEVLDANNGEKMYKLSGDEGEDENEENEKENTNECDDGSGDGDDGDASFLELPPCPVSGDNGMNDPLNPSLYEGGEPNVAPRHRNSFHKVKEVESGSIDSADIITDLDDPPPKTLPIEGVPLAEIVVGSSAPKNEEEASGLAEVGLTD